MLGSAPQPSINTVVVLPKALYKIAGSNTANYTVANTFDSSTLLQLGTNSYDAMNAAIVGLAEKIVVSVLLGNQYWVFITHFDFFMQTTKLW